MKTDVIEFYGQFKIMKLQLSIQRNCKVFCFQVFSKGRGAFRTQSNNPVNHFYKKHHLKCLTGF